MSEGAKVFSLKNTILLVATVPIGQIGGFADSDALEIEAKSDSFVSVEGVDGSVAYADTQSRLFLMKVKLLQTSAANLAMTGIYEAQQASKLLFPVAYKDLSGVDVFVATSCVITKPPKINRGNKITSHEWALECADGKLFLGGN